MYANLGTQLVPMGIKLLEFDYARVGYEKKRFIDGDCLGRCL